MEKERKKGKRREREKKKGKKKKEEEENRSVSSVELAFFKEIGPGISPFARASPKKMYHLSCNK